MLRNKKKNRYNSQGAGHIIRSKRNFNQSEDTIVSCRQLGIYVAVDFLYALLAGNYIATKLSEDDYIFHVILTNNARG